MRSHLKHAVKSKGLVDKKEEITPVYHLGFTFKSTYTKQSP